MGPVDAGAAMSHNCRVNGAAQLARALVGRRIAVLTGAGCSTESGIPDYRGEGTRARARNPIQYRQFISSPQVRARYWVRSMVGYQRVARARPNDAHRALAELERADLLSGLITQNVDGLHHAAGSRDVIELHGNLARVVCLDCGRGEERDHVQARLAALNPLLAAVDPAATSAAPDGDADVELGDFEFEIPSCLFCQGTLKPDVVFFGESVPRPRTEAAWKAFDHGEALLVAGSSLAVFSGYRFVRRAAERGMPVYIVNIGPTRGDPYASARIDESVGSALPALARALGATRDPA
ncbi:MAG: NAD-dependent protein deacetylase [Deltaproteobacteria bacterium]|nr:NAD-dependent protein deacetylase [Deltaproteobacteria bacterium]